MKPLTIEINGTGTHNRGAELMAIAIGERLTASFPNARIVVSSCFGSRKEIAKYGFYRTWEYRGLVIGKIKSIISGALRLFQRGVVDPSEIDVVLDASGFAFSDQWGERRAVRETQALLHSGRAHQTLIMLPQAFGPFKDAGVIKECKRMFDRAELICARDSQSFESVKKLGFEGKLRQYPDFTVGVSAIEPKLSSLPKNYVAIVPNYRMLDKTGNAQLYVSFLQHAISSIRSVNLHPVFVLHDSSEDRKVIDRLGSEYNQLPILTDSDPRILKGMLSNAEFVIGSRFHALVSSLSQGVPCIGAGWSHKYPELFRDFDCSELLLPDLADLASLNKLIGSLSQSDSKAEQIERIKKAGLDLKDKAKCMWQEVEAIISRVEKSK